MFCEVLEMHMVVMTSCVNLLRNVYGTCVLKSAVVMFPVYEVAFMREGERGAVKLV
jgi:hypothetical protein